MISITERTRNGFSPFSIHGTRLNSSSHSILKAASFKIPISTKERTGCMRTLSVREREISIFEVFRRQGPKYFLYLACLTKRACSNCDRALGLARIPTTHMKTRNAETWKGPPVSPESSSTNSANLFMTRSRSRRCMGIGHQSNALALKDCTLTVSLWLKGGLVEELRNLANQRETTDTPLPLTAKDIFDCATSSTVGLNSHPKTPLPPQSSSGRSHMGNLARPMKTTARDGDDPIEPEVDILNKFFIRTSNGQCGKPTQAGYRDHLYNFLTPRNPSERIDIYSGEGPSVLQQKLFPRSSIKAIGPTLLNT